MISDMVKDDAALAKSQPDPRESQRRDEKLLLRMMRSPESLIERVTETWELQRTIVRRNLTVQLNEQAAKKRDYVYLDLVHPAKGSVYDIEIKNGSAEILNHGRHTELSAALIWYRFGTLVRSIKTDSILPAAALDNLATAIAELSEIPQMSVAKSEAVLWKYFDRQTRTLTLFQGINELLGVEWDRERMAAFYRLCHRLTFKYLLLVRVPVTKNRGGSVSFSFEQAITEEDTELPWWMKIPVLLKHLGYIGNPASVRMHIPWAKRTSHYSFQITAPETQFFSTTTLLHGSLAASKPPTLIAVTPDADVPYSWSINSAQGRSANFFLGNARAANYQLYIGLRLLEQPGYSTSRALTLAVFVTLLIGVFSFLVGFSAKGVTDSAALVLSLLAIGAFASSPSPGQGVLRTPILSRFAPIALGFLSATFVIWQACRQVSVHGSWILWKPARDTLSSLWHFWIDWGWAGIFLPCVCLVLWLYMRRRRHINEYLTAQSRSHIVKTTFP